MAIRPEQLKQITSVAQAAAEIKNLYITFNSTAVDFNDDYWRSRFDGLKGKTWDVVEHGFFRGRKFPILDEVLRDKKKIKLGAYMSRMNGVLYRYYLQEISTQPGTTRIHECGFGYDPGQDYLATPGGQILQAVLNRPGGLVPSFGPDGAVTGWESPRAYLDLGSHQELQSVNPQLLKLIREVQAYQ